jgi:hypothetical protein
VPNDTIAFNGLHAKKLQGGDARLCAKGCQRASSGIFRAGTEQNTPRGTREKSANCDASSSQGISLHAQRPAVLAGSARHSQHVAAASVETRGRFSFGTPGGPDVHIAALIVGSLIAGQAGAAPIGTRPVAANGPEVMQEPTAEFDSLADDLRISRKMFSLALPTRPSHLLIEGDFYKQGNQLPYHLSLDRRYDLSVSSQQGFRFAMHVIDLGYLRLGDAKPDSYRWRLMVIDNIGIESAAQVDVPKNEVDFRANRFGLFVPEPGVQNRMPLCYVLTGSEQPQHRQPPRTFQEFLRDKQHANGFVVFATWQ